MRWWNWEKIPAHNILFDYYFYFILWNIDRNCYCWSVFWCRIHTSKRSHVQEHDQNSTQWFCYWLFLVCNGFGRDCYRTHTHTASSRARFSFSTETYTCWGHVGCQQNRSIPTDPQIDYDFLLYRSPDVMRLLNYINTKMSTHFHRITPVWDGLYRCLLTLCGHGHSHLMRLSWYGS